MTNATEKYSKLMQDMMEAVPMDDAALQAMGKVQAELTDQMTKAVLEAVEKSADVSTKWTQAALVKAAQLAKTTDHPDGYAHAMTDFISLTTEMATDYVTNYSEIAKQVQLETIKIMLATHEDLVETVSADTENAVVTPERSPSTAPKETTAPLEAAVTETAAQTSPAPEAQDHQPTEQKASVQKKPTPPKTKA